MIIFGDVFKRSRALWSPPPLLSVSEWADQFRQLSSESSGEPGQWRTDRAPYQKGIMDALSDPAVEQVTVMSSAQVGKTEFINNAVGYFIHQDPSPIMVVQPTVEAAKKWSKTRLAPMLRDTPVLRSKVAEAKSRDDSNTIQEKTFPGGLLVIVGSNAPAGLSSQPIRVVLCDEVDRFEESAGTEGDPVDLAFKRTTTFTGRRKHVLISTPGIKGVSRIEKAWLESDQRHYRVSCPHCGLYQDLKFGNLVWPDGKPLEAAYGCEHCGGVITDAQKSTMLRTGHWKAARPEVTDHAGFHLNELYSPWRRFGEVAKDFLKAKRRGISSLQVWVNTALGEPWDPRDGEDIQAKGLMLRREVYSAEIPAGVAVLVAGADVQDDRLEVSVWGYGRGEETWLIRHQVFPGNLALGEVWQRLDDVLQREWAREGGGSMRVAACAVDSGGHFTRQVYAFCRSRAQRVVFPVKGASRPLGGKVIKKAAKRSQLWQVDTNAVKDQLAARLRVDVPGTGFIHFPIDLGQEWFEQITSEKITKKRVNGQEVRIWEKVNSGGRNEALDCAVYAAAAYERLGIRDIEPILERQQQMDAPAEEYPEPAPAPPPRVVPVHHRPPARPSLRSYW